MVTFLCLFKKLKMLFKFLCCWETYTIYSLHYMIAGISLPVYTRIFNKLEVLAELSIINMRSATEVCEIALVINCDIAIFKTAYKVKLIHIILEHLKCFFLRNFSSVYLLAFLADFLHLFFDSFNSFVIDYIISKVYIIIESLFNYWSNPELSMWIQMLNCLCHNMCT